MHKKDAGIEVASSRRLMFLHSNSAFKFFVRIILWHCRSASPLKDLNETADLDAMVQFARIA